MRLTLTLILIALTSLTALSACDQKSADNTAQAAVEAPEITVEALSAIVEKKDAVTIVDANGAETRAKNGIIPGAVLMKGDNDTSVLPASKDHGLVFYCGSEQCASAPKAAAAALAAGYKDVKVLKVGIKGWVAAGKKTEPAPEG
jgi:rhodanese-related sulfurtransferase